MSNKFEFLKLPNTEVDIFVARCLPLGLTAYGENMEEEGKNG